jgi:hypothetical protein
LICTFSSPSILLGTVIVALPIRFVSLVSALRGPSMAGACDAWQGENVIRHLSCLLRGACPGLCAFWGRRVFALCHGRGGVHHGIRPVLVSFFLPVTSRAPRSLTGERERSWGLEGRSDSEESWFTTFLHCFFLSFMTCFCFRPSRHSFIHCIIRCFS